jgi:hypothetical protein
MSPHEDQCPATVLSAALACPAADVHHAIGAGHAVCQDFALGGLGPGGRPFAIVSDGCSSARHADIGATLIAAAARRMCMRDAAIEVPAVLRTAWHQAQALELPSSSLDATLLYAQPCGEQLVCVLAGDGVLGARRRDGSIEAWAVQVPSGAPPYPSYLLEPARLAAYLATRPERRIEHWRRPGGARQAASCERSWLEPVRALPLEARAEPGEPAGGYLRRFELPIRDFDLVMLLSDGDTSFGRSCDSDTSRHVEAVPLGAVLGELLAMPGTRGEFVVRRCRRFLGSFCREHGWRNHDDLGVAAIAWGAST